MSPIKTTGGSQMGLKLIEKKDFNIYDWEELIQSVSTRCTPIHRRSFLRGGGIMLIGLSVPLLSTTKSVKAQGFEEFTVQGYVSAEYRSEISFSEEEYSFEETAVASYVLINASGSNQRGPIGSGCWDQDAGWWYQQEIEIMLETQAMYTVEDDFVCRNPGYSEYHSFTRTDRKSANLRVTSA
jgi:hypothetical protein